MKRILLLSLCAISTATGVDAKKEPRDSEPVRTSVWSDVVSRDRLDPVTGTPAALHALAPANTLVLASYTFNSGSTCTAQGWTTVDVSRHDGVFFFSLPGGQTGDYWHVDDFASSNSLGTIPPGHMSTGEIPFTPIQGAKSMWVGQRVPPAGPPDLVHCSYLALPGYGNNWSQSFGTKNCLAVSGGATANLDIAFRIKFDVQPSYDYTALEYTNDCTGNTGWIEFEGGNPAWSGPSNWDGQESRKITGPYAVGTGPVRVRFLFRSDTAWSNQDGLFPGFGAAIDSLSIEQFPVEDFEDEPIGAHETADWTTLQYGFGNYLALFKKTTGANHEDECADNISCYWAALQGSTDFYTCGTPPQAGQNVAPYVNIRGEYLANEIWSPVIPLSGSGNEFRLRYSVYRDLPFDNLVFHLWRVRSIPVSGCPGPWRSRDFLYYGDTKDWAVAEHAVGTLLTYTNLVAVQVALGVVDMCRLWCGDMGSGTCHSPAPYFDNVEILRVDTVGPQWDVRTIDTYQDTFAANGTITGTARIDAAIDVKPAASPSFTPGDSTVVFYLVDPKYIVGSGTNANGLLNDPNLSTFVGRHKTKKQAYMWVAVWPPGQPGKSGAPLSDGPGGQANRYPFAGTQVIDGVTWTKIRMDFTYTGSTTNPGDGVFPDPFVANRFNVDINDNLFTPGDTILYFFGATSADGTTYYSTEYGPTSNISEVAANPMEVTILPAGGFNRGGDLLYVDGADGLGNQAYFDGAFLVMGLEDLIDRYDVRSPSSGMANRLSSRVVDVQQQLNDCYAHIEWDCGSLSATLGDGTGSPLKCDDYNLLSTFLGNLVNPGGLYLSGDDLAENLIASTSASAVTFRSTYMPFVLANSSHRAAGFGVSPAIKLWPGRAFADDFFVFGGCPELNDFDVMNASGTSRVEMSYQTAQSPNGAVVSNKNGDATVVLSGFSFAAVRDDELDGLSDRARFLRNAIRYSGTGPLDPVTGTRPAPSNSLSQNYPNPFNPTTTIAFSLATRGRVSVRVYNVAGELVRTLANGQHAAGPHAVTWDGRDEAGSPVSSGVYFYKLVAGSFSQTKKMVLLK